MCIRGLSLPLSPSFFLWLFPLLQYRHHYYFRVYNAPDSFDFLALFGHFVERWPLCIFSLLYEFHPPPTVAHRVQRP